MCITTELSTAVQADAVQIQGSRGLQKRQSKYSKNKNKTDKRPPSHNWPVRSSVPMSDWQRDNGLSAMHKTTLTQLASQKFCAPARLAAWQRTICCLHAHLHNIPRHQFWSVQTLVGRKLFSSLEDLQCMAALVQRTGASSWDINRRPFNLFYKTFPADFHVNKPQTKGLPFFKTTTAWFF